MDHQSELSKLRDDNLSMTNNLFYGNIDSRFINIDSDSVDKNPQ